MEFLVAGPLGLDISKICRGLPQMLRQTESPRVPG